MHVLLPGSPSLLWLNVLKQWSDLIYSQGTTTLTANKITSKRLILSYNHKLLCLNLTAIQHLLFGFINC